MILKNYKHEQFARAMAKDGLSQTKAAVAAGYAEPTAHIQGSKLMRDPKIRNRVTELKERVTDQTVAVLSIDKTWILQRLVELAQKCVSDKRWSPAAAAKALELLGKDLGMFKDYVSLEVHTNLMSQMGLVVAQVIQDEDQLARIVNGWEKINAKIPKSLPAAVVDVQPITETVSDDGPGEE